MRWIATHSGARSPRSRPSNTSSPTFMLRSSWQDRTPTTAPGPSRPAPRRSQSRAPPPRGAPERPAAGAAARVAATEAFHLASKENIQTHGGIGFTWEADCHFYYRRSKLLAVSIGSAPYWKDRLIAALERRNAP